MMDDRRNDPAIRTTPVEPSEVWTPDQTAQLERDRETLLGAARALDKLFDAGRKKAVEQLAGLEDDQLKAVEKLGKGLAVIAREERRARKDPRRRR